MNTPPDVPIKPIRRSLLERFSIVWLIPLLALAIALGVAWQTWSDRGPLIVITFESASGIKERETVLRFRDVNVGLVEKVSFSALLEQVEVSVRIDKDIAPFIDDDATFWVVRPVVTAQGITGLGTVLSGVYIEGIWNTGPNGLQTRHVGLENAPLLGIGETGLHVELRAQGTAALSEGTPILYKGIPVGRTGKPRLIGDGTEAVSDAIIYAPHDQLVNSATRFWDVSGFSFKIGAGGAELDFSSLATLISGGITFETIVSGGEPISDGTQFDAYSDEASARNSVFSSSNGPSLDLTVIFDENLSGLSAGSAVEFGGVRIGEVKALRGLVDADRFGDTRVRLLATLEIRPDRLGLTDDIKPETALAFLTERVADGLRARLATASILTGGLKVEFLRVEEALPARLERPAEGLPIIPTTANNVQDVAATAEGVLKRVNDLPIEQLLGSVISFLDNASTLVSSSDMQNLPGEAMGLLSEARGVIGSEEVQKLPKSVNDLVVGLQTTVEDLSAVLEQIEQADTINRLLASVEAAGAAAKEVGTALDGMPGLIDQIEALAEKANGLPLEDLISQATGLAESARALLASDATKALPTSVNAAIADLQKVVTDLTEKDGVNRLLAAVDAAGTAATQVGTALDGVPGLVTQIETLAAKATELPLEDLLAQAKTLVGSANTLLTDEGTKALPATLNAAMAELQKVVTEVTTQDGVARLLKALDATGTAATEAGAAFKGVPELVAELSDVAKKANALPVDQLIERLSKITDTADTLLSSEGAQDLPANLSSALAQLQAVIAELRDGGTIENANKTLASAANAADAIAVATNDLPALVARVNALMAQASTTLDGFDGNSQINRDMRSALREIESAAKAISSLSRAIERRPNSLILGR